MKAPRSNYAARLAEFPDIAGGDVDFLHRKGKWRAFFAERIGPTFNGQIVFEVGCGDAGFLARVAAKHPSMAFVGLDWKYKALYDGAQRVADEGFRNVALVRGRGQDVSCLFGDREIDELWLFHPDPCDRAAELKNRLFSEAFLLDVHSILASNTSAFVLKTDHAGYYQWALALLGLAQPAWEGRRVRIGDLMDPAALPRRSDPICERFSVASHAADYWSDSIALRHTAARAFSGETTGFERRFMSKRLPIYFLELQPKK